MGGLPVSLVELDDGTGTFPHDVTRYVDLTRGYSITSGRANNFDSIDPSSLTISFKNNAAHFTLGSPTFDIAVDQMIRVTETLNATTVRQFTGYVQNWPMSWDSPVGNKSTVTVTATDRLARLERRKLRSMLEQEILLNSPDAYYTLGEPEGSTTAGDTSGIRRASLTQAGSGTAVTFGNGTGSGTDGLTAAQFAAGKYLTTTAGVGFSGCTLHAFIKPTVPSSTATVILNAGAASTTWPIPRTFGLFVDTSGRITATIQGTTVTGPIITGQTHHVAATHPGGPTGPLSLYVDGALVASSAASAALGPYDAPLVIGDGLTATLSHVALHSSSLTAGAIADIATAGLTGFNGEATDDRVARLAAYANIPTADLDLETGVASLTPQATLGSSVMDALNDAATTEGGVLFVAGDGKLTLQNRSHRVLAATSPASVALTTADVDPDLQWSADKNYLTNYVEATRPNGAAQVAQDAASIAAYEQYPLSLSMLVASDSEVSAAATWRVHAYGSISPRLSSVTIDLMTLADDALREQILALTLGDRITISGFPSQSPVTTANLIIEGAAKATSTNAWSVTFNTIPAADFVAWVLEDPVYGVLGSTTRLYY